MTTVVHWNTNLDVGLSVNCSLEKFYYTNLNMLNCNNPRKERTVLDRMLTNQKELTATENAL